jgi:hypothetical protein
MANVAEENKGASVERIQETKQETESKDPFARLEAMAATARGGTKAAKESAVKSVEAQLGGVESVGGTIADRTALEQQVAPGLQQMEEVVAETDQQIEGVMARGVLAMGETTLAGVPRPEIANVAPANEGVQNAEIAQHQQNYEARSGAEATAPAENIEDPKQKAFKEQQARFSEEAEKKAADLENPVNKISAAFAKDGFIGRELRSGFDSNIARKLGVEQIQLDEALPELLVKGVITEKEVSSYIVSSTLEGRNGLNMARFTKLAETIPAQVMAKMVNADGMLGDAFDKWYNATRSEIDKELTAKRPINDGRIMLDNPDKIIKAISNAGRFANEGELDAAMKDAMESYKILPSSIKFRQEAEGQYKYPVLENLFDAGYSNQAEEILQDGLSKREISSQVVLEYQKKGYITEERAKAMLDSAGQLS